MTEAKNNLGNSLNSYTLEPQLDPELLFDLIINDFEEPELAVFDEKVGPKSLANISNKIEIEGDDGLLKYALIQYFFNINCIPKVGLMFLETDYGNFYSVNFFIDNEERRAGNDAYVLFTRCNNDIINKKRLKADLEAIAETYASLIKAGNFKDELLSREGIYISK